MAGMVRGTTEPFADLDPATVAVRDLIGVSRLLVARVAEHMGMGVNDMSAIGELLQHGPMGAAALAGRLGITSASATVLVDRLERAGHVVRERDTQDRRRVTVTLTPAARRATAEAWEGQITAFDAVARRLSPADRAVVVGFLGAITEVATPSGATRQRATP